MAEEKAKEEAPKKKSKLPLLIVAAVLLLGGGGAGAWFFLKKPAPDAQADAGDHPVSTGRRTGPRTFVPLDPFTFNLFDNERDRFAQVALVLEIVDSSTEAKIKELSPALRNALLLLLTSKSSEDLLSVRGKERLALEIAETANAVLAGDDPPRIRVSEPRRDDSRNSARPTGERDDRNVREDDRDARDDRFDDRRDDDRFERRRPRWPERVAAVHFNQFIVQ